MSGFATERHPGIHYVSPSWGDPVKASGYVYIAPCGWWSPVMRWQEGADRHRREHACWAGWAEPLRKIARPRPRTLDPEAAPLVCAERPVSDSPGHGGTGR